MTKNPGKCTSLFRDIAYTGMDKCTIYKGTRTSTLNTKLLNSVKPTEREKTPLGNQADV